MSNGTPIDDLIREIDSQLGYEEEGEQSKDNAQTESKTDATKEDDKFIPKARFDAEIKRQREQNAALERKLAELSQQSQKSAEKDPIQELAKQRTDLEDALDNAILDGDKDAIRAARNALRAVESQERDILVQFAVKNSAVVSRETTTYSQAARDIEQRYPELDSNSDVYDEPKTEAVLALMAGYVQGGKDKTTALRQAATIIMGDRSEAQNAKSAKGQRDRAQRAAALDAASRQPPLSPRYGNAPSERTVAMDVSKLSDAEFSKLSDRHLSVLRGDTLD